MEHIPFRSISGYRLWWSVVLFALCCTLPALATPPAGNGQGNQFFGSIYTTGQNGGGVNINIFQAKTAVYLNGGPQNQNASGLPIGSYYFQVTDPSGAVLLSADDISCRVVKVIADPNNANITRFAGAVASGCSHPNGTFDAASGTTPAQLCPATTRSDASNGANPNFDGTNWCDTTPSNAGEYKAWLTPTSKYNESCSNSTFGFCDKDSKTDNFKIRPACSGANCNPTTTIVWPLGGTKFYDANTDGVQDPSELVINNWQVRAVKSCQEDQAILTAELQNIIGGTVSLPVNDGDFLTPVALNLNIYGTYGRQFQPTAPGTYEAEAFQDPTPGNQTTFVSAGGFYQFQNLNAGGHYSVCEIIPLGTASVFPTGLSTLSGQPKWHATTSTESDDHFLPNNGADFGNVCTGAGGGYTLGFWSNTNGESVMAYGPSFPNKVPKSCYTTADNSPGMTATLAYLTRTFDTYGNLVSGFNLVDGSGTYINPSKMSYCNFRKWLLGATSTNSAYMLSAQLAAMALNVHFGYVNPNALIYAPGTITANPAGFATVAAVMAEANDSLGAHPSVVVNSTLNNNVSLKSYQVTVKNALDNANNNLGFVQPGPGSCAIAYKDESVNSCSTADAPLIGTTATSQPLPQNTGGGTGCAVNELMQALCAPAGGTFANNTCTLPQP